MTKEKIINYAMSTPHNTNEAVLNAIIDQHDKETLDNAGFVKTVNGQGPDEQGNVDVATVASWNDLTDKPFYEEKAEDIIYIDTDFETKYDAGGDVYGDFNLSTVSKPTLVDGMQAIMHITIDDVIAEKTVTLRKNSYNQYSCSAYVNNGYEEIYVSIKIFASHTSFELKTSVYYETSGHITLILPGEIIIEPLDEKFLPKASAIADVTEAPTAEQFNALLAALRAAGYMKE